MVMNSEEKAPKKRNHIKTFFPEIASKTGLSEQDVAKVSRMLVKHIREVIERGEVLHTNSIVVQSVVKPAKPENDKRGALPERIAGRILLKDIKNESKNS